MTVIDVVKALQGQKFPVSSETALQMAIEARLVEIEAEFEREYRLDDKNRIDFMISGGIGLEAKTRYPRKAIYRQLQRYAAIDEVKSLILVTGTAMGMPPALNGKPIYFVSIGLGWL